uniref:Uncharacterized protein n=1 Tax=Sphaerodactylus townsendi TaxID=933632 RepID=A0ACB8FTY9_9SAUR
MAAATPASIAQYCIDTPSVTQDSALDEMDTPQNITVHLNQIVQTMEIVYTMDDRVTEEEEEEKATLPHHCEDRISFLIICTQLGNQVDAALHEEKEILESWLKWFEKEVQMMKELGEGELLPDWQIPVADKNITDNINKLMNRIQRPEDLKGRVQESPKYIRTSTPREKRRQLGPPPALKDPKNIIQELALKHATEDVMNMVQVFQDDSGAPQTTESMNDRMVEIMEVFERQTNKLHRVTNEHDAVESKLQKIQQDFQKLAEEKQVMEDEFLKMKTSDGTLKASADTRKTLLAKLEKEKVVLSQKRGKSLKSAPSKRWSTQEKMEQIYLNLNVALFIKYLLVLLKNSPTIILMPKGVQNPKSLRIGENDVQQRKVLGKNRLQLFHHYLQIKKSNSCLIQQISRQNLLRSVQKSNKKCFVVELQEETPPVIEPESADLVSSCLTEPEEFVGESECLEKATAKPRTSLRTRTSFTGLQEDETKELMDEGMLQLADHLTDLKGMLETETLARLLLEPGKGLETL